MNERRLLEDGASVLEHEVLSAWEDEKAPEGTRTRALHLAAKTAGIAVVAAGTTKGLAGLGAKGFGWGTSWLVKGMAMGLFVGASAALVATSMTAARPLAEVNEPPVPLTRTPPGASAPPVAPIVVTEAAAAPTSAPLATPKPKVHAAPRTPIAAPAAVPTLAAQTPKPAPTGSSTPRFTEEVHMLGDAKSALAARDPERALLVLDTFATLYPSSGLTPEAEVLRIDAHVARGDRARAKALAATFLASRPSSPYRKHVQSTQLAE